MKRFLSIILAIAMIIAMIPAVFASGETTRTYEFSSNETGKTGTAPNVDRYDFDGTNHGWQYININSETEAVDSEHKHRVYQLQPEYLRMCSYRVNGGVTQVKVEKGIQLALAIEKPSTEPGFYKATVANGQYTGAKPVQFWMGKWDGSKNKSVGTYMTNAAKFNSDPIVAAGSAEPLDGVIYNNGTDDFAFVINTNQLCSFDLKSLTLDKISPDISLSLNKTVIDLNDTATASVNATWTDDEGAKTQKVLNDYVTYESDKPGVVTVSNDAEDKGTITTHGTGTATITATVGGVPYSQEITVADFSGVTVEYSFADADYDVSPVEINYNNSCGRIEYHSNNSTYDSLSYWNNGYPVIHLKGNQYIAYKIRVPVAGEYGVTFGYNDYQMGTINVYILPTTVTNIPAEIGTATPLFENIEYTETKKVLERTKNIYEFATAGEYYLVLKKVANYAEVRPAYLKLNGGNTKNPLIFADVSIETTTLGVGETTTLTKGTAYLASGTQTDLTDVSYISKNPNVATLNDEKTTVTAIGEGTTKIQAVRADGYVLDEVEVTVESKDLKDAFAHESTTPNAVTVPTEGVTVNTYVYTVDGEKKELDDSVTVPAGTSYKVDAHEIAGMDGYEFLYWAKGVTMDKKQIVSGNAEYTFVPTVEATHLIAVFATKTASGTAKAEFYNGNGQLLPDYTVTSGDTVTIPELPSMAGYGDATHWELYGDTKEYKEGDEVALSESMIFVAQYDELEADIIVDVTGGSCDETAYKYGDVVTCTPDDEANFKCWKKDGVIVSMDKTYTFNAWESCTVEAVTGEHLFTGKATKLLIDIINDKFIMAEFIGLSNYGAVVEKGIMIGNKRFAMQKPLATQFTLEAKDATEAQTAVAYAIFNNGTMITDK